MFCSHNVIAFIRYNILITQLGKYLCAHFLRQDITVWNVPTVNCSTFWHDNSLSHMLLLPKNIIFTTWYTYHGSGNSGSPPVRNRSALSGLEKKSLTHPRPLARNPLRATLLSWLTTNESSFTWLMICLHKAPTRDCMQTFLCFSQWALRHSLLQ